MKKIFIALMTLMPIVASAQDNTWERAPQTQSDGNPDQKYLAGAVPLINGRVIFETTIEAQGKSAGQIYDIMLKELQNIAKEDGQFEQSRVTLEDKDNFRLVANYQEWLVFKSTALVLDRTRLMYHIMVECSDGNATVKMMRISYLYDEERDPQTFVAEEWITDKYGLTKKQNKLSRVSGKFRKKTIDRKDYLFKRFTSALNN